MKPTVLNMGMYTIYPANGGYQEKQKMGLCPDCGFDMGYIAPMMDIDETYVTIGVSCPSCGKKHVLWHGTGAKVKCEPKSSPAPTVADF